MKTNAIVIKKTDNVATALKDLDIGDAGIFSSGNIEIKEKIPFGHKFALRDINKGENVIKYGENIGMATISIKSGTHVHIHNVESLRGRGDINREAAEK
jgi:altronate dehydratase small subunit